MSEFKNVFDHKVRLLKTMCGVLNDTDGPKYMVWAANHMLAQRIRLANQYETIQELQKEVASLKNRIDDFEYENIYGEDG